MSSVALLKSGGYRVCKDCHREFRLRGSGVAKHGLFYMLLFREDKIKIYVRIKQINYDYYKNTFPHVFFWRRNGHGRLFQRELRRGSLDDF